MSVVVGLLTENTSRMLVQATRLVRSIRWFGGGLSSARVVVCGVGELESRARKTLDDLGAEIRIVSRFHPANPTANRHQLVAELLDAPEELLLFLDCDTIVVQDPLPHLRRDVFQAKIEVGPTVTDEVFNRLFPYFGLQKPPLAHVMSFTGTPTIPYFNAGVMAIPKAMARTLASPWRRYNQILADNPQLAAPCERHMHQASLALALSETGLPYAELPAAMNYQLNTAHLTTPPWFDEIDPVIIHYHHLADDDGFLLPTPHPSAQARIDMFHERMRAEGFVREQKASSAQESRPIAVLGMHRSGTSLVAQLISAMGSYAGESYDLTPPDMFNPTGYWEHRDVVGTNRDIMAALSATWTDAAGANVSRLLEEQRELFLERARAGVKALQVRGSFVIKDPRFAFLFPLWREVLEDPICIIAWRAPAAVAQSMATRDKRPPLVTIAAWEHYNRAILRETQGLPRFLVSYEELLADPLRVARELHAALTGEGVQGLTVPSEESLRQIVKPDFNRSGSRAESHESLVDAAQQALIADLRSGEALRRSPAPISPQTRELLAVYTQLEKNEVQLRGRVAELDLLLSGVFESRSWKIGHGLTGVVRRKDAISSADRWRELKKKPL